MAQIFKNAGQREAYEKNKPFFIRLQSIESELKNITNALRGSATPSQQAKQGRSIYSGAGMSQFSMGLNKLNKNIVTMQAAQSRMVGEVLDKFTKERQEEQKQATTTMTGVVSSFEAIVEKFWLRHPVLYDMSKAFKFFADKMKDVDTLFGLFKRQEQFSAWRNEYKIFKLSPMASIVSINQAIHKKLWFLVERHLPKYHEELIGALKGGGTGGAGGGRFNVSSRLAYALEGTPDERSERAARLATYKTLESFQHIKDDAKKKKIEEMGETYFEKYVTGQIKSTASYVGKITGNILKLKAANFVLTPMRSMIEKTVGRSKTTEALKEVEELGMPGIIWKYGLMEPLGGLMESSGISGYFRRFKMQRAKAEEDLETELKLEKLEEQAEQHRKEMKDAQILFQKELDKSKKKRAKMTGGEIVKGRKEFLNTLDRMYEAGGPLEKKDVSFLIRKHAYLFSDKGEMEDALKAAEEMYVSDAKAKLQDQEVLFGSKKVGGLFQQNYLSAVLDSLSLVNTNIIDGTYAMINHGVKLKEVSDPFLLNLNNTLVDIFDRYLNPDRVFMVNEIASSSGGGGGGGPRLLSTRSFQGPAAQRMAAYSKGLASKAFQGPGGLGSIIDAASAGDEFALNFLQNSLYDYFKDVENLDSKSARGEAASMLNIFLDPKQKSPFVQSHYKFFKDTLKSVKQPPREFGGRKVSPDTYKHAIDKQKSISAESRINIQEVLNMTKVDPSKLGKSDADKFLKDALDTSEAHQQVGSIFEALRSYRNAGDMRNLVEHIKLNSTSTEEFTEAVDSLIAYVESNKNNYSDPDFLIKYLGAVKLAAHGVPGALSKDDIRNKNIIDFQSRQKEAELRYGVKKMLHEKTKQDFKDSFDDADKWRKGLHKTAKEQTAQLKKNLSDRVKDEEKFRIMMEQTEKKDSQMRKQEISEWLERYEGHDISLITKSILQAFPVNKDNEEIIKKLMQQARIKVAKNASKWIESERFDLSSAAVAKSTQGYNILQDAFKSMKRIKDGKEKDKQFKHIRNMAEKNIRRVVENSTRGKDLLGRNYKTAVKMIRHALYTGLVDGDFAKDMMSMLSSRTGKESDYLVDAMAIGGKDALTKEEAEKVKGEGLSKTTPWQKYLMGLSGRLDKVIDNTSLTAIGLKDMSKNLLEKAKAKISDLKGKTFGPSFGKLFWAMLGMPFMVDAFNVIESIFKGEFSWKELGLNVAFGSKKGGMFNGILTAIKWSLAAGMIPGLGLLAMPVAGWLGFNVGVTGRDDLGKLLAKKDYSTMFEKVTGIENMSGTVKTTIYTIAGLGIGAKVGALFANPLVGSLLGAGIGMMYANRKGHAGKAVNEMIKSPGAIFNSMKNMYKMIPGNVKRIIESVLFAKAGFFAGNLLLPGAGGILGMAAGALTPWINKINWNDVGMGISTAASIYEDYVPEETKYFIEAAAAAKAAFIASGGNPIAVAAAVAGVTGTRWAISKIFGDELKKSTAKLAVEKTKGSFIKTFKENFADTSYNMMIEGLDKSYKAALQTLKDAGIEVTSDKYKTKISPLQSRKAIEVLVNNYISDPDHKMTISDLRFQLGKFISDKDTINGIVQHAKYARGAWKKKELIKDSYWTGDSKQYVADYEKKNKDLRRFLRRNITHGKLKQTFQASTEAFTLLSAKADKNQRRAETRYLEKYNKVRAILEVSLQGPINSKRLKDLSTKIEELIIMRDKVLSGKNVDPNMVGLVMQEAESMSRLYGEAVIKSSKDSIEEGDQAYAKKMRPVLDNLIRKLHNKTKYGKAILSKEPTEENIKESLKKKPEVKKEAGELKTWREKIMDQLATAGILNAKDKRFRIKWISESLEGLSVATMKGLSKAFDELGIDPEKTAQKLISKLKKAGGKIWDFGKDLAIVGGAIVDEALAVMGFDFGVSKYIKDPQLVAELMITKLLTPAANAMGDYVGPGGVLVSREMWKKGFDYIKKYSPEMAVWVKKKKLDKGEITTKDVKSTLLKGYKTSEAYVKKYGRKAKAFFSDFIDFDDPTVDAEALGFKDPVEFKNATLDELRAKQEQVKLEMKKAKNEEEKKKAEARMRFVKDQINHSISVAMNQTNSTAVQSAGGAATAAVGIPGNMVMAQIFETGNLVDLVNVGG